MTPEYEKRIRQHIDQYGYEGEEEVLLAALDEARKELERVKTRLAFDEDGPPAIERGKLQDRLSEAQLHISNLESEWEQAKEVIWRQHLALQVGHNDYSDYGAAKFQPSRLSNMERKGL